MNFQQRRNTLRTQAQNENLQYVWIKDPANVFYYTGFLSDPHERFMAYIQNIASGEVFFFVPALDVTAAKQVSDIDNIIGIADTDDPLTIVQHTCGTIKGNIGIESKVLSHYLATSFQYVFAETTFVDFQPVINKQRLQKSPEEIEALQLAIDLIEKVLAEGIKQIKIGMTEAEVVAELEFLMRKFGADGPSFGTIVLSGKKAALPHGIPDESTIKNGDLLLIDFGVIKDGYCSDITRTFAIGDVDERQKAIYEIVKQANETAIASIQANQPLQLFDQAARDVIEGKGYSEYFTTRVGHGLGIEVHEEPSIHGRNVELSSPGMVFTIEPGIYIPNDIGVRIEDIIYMKEDGNVDVLTSFPKELITIG